MVIINEKDCSMLALLAIGLLSNDIQMFMKPAHRNIEPIEASNRVKEIFAKVINEYLSSNSVQELFQSSEKNKRANIERD